MAGAWGWRAPSSARSLIDFAPAVSQENVKKIWRKRQGCRTEGMRFVFSTSLVGFHPLVASRNGAIPVGPVHPLLPVSSGSASRTVAGFQYCLLKTPSDSAEIDIRPNVAMLHALSSSQSFDLRRDISVSKDWPRLSSRRSAAFTTAAPTWSLCRSTAEMLMRNFPIFPAMLFPKRWRDQSRIASDGSRQGMRWA